MFFHTRYQILQLSSHGPMIYTVISGVRNTDKDQSTSDEFMAWINMKLWDVITHPCPKYTDGLIKSIYPFARSQVIKTSLELLV